MMGIDSQYGATPFGKRKREPEDHLSRSSMGISSFAMNNTRGIHTCDDCGNPYNPVVVHDCPEKRARMVTGLPEHMAYHDPGPLLKKNLDPVVWSEPLGPDTIEYRIENVPNEQAATILMYVLPKTLELFLRKNRDYGDEHTKNMRLGPKAQFVDIWRKLVKLKRALWDGQPLQGEQPEEIIDDFIGHCLLAKWDYYISSQTEQEV